MSQPAESVATKSAAPPKRLVSISTPGRAPHSPKAWLALALQWAPAIAAAGIIVVFVLLCRYTEPQADDLDFAVIYRRYGFLGSQKAWAYGWNGRYFFNAVASLTLGHLPLLRAYWTVPVLGFIASAGVTIYLVRTVFPKARPLALYPAATVWFAFYLLTAPAKSDTFYWIIGIFTYPIANASLALFLVALVRIFDRAEQKERLRALALACLWIFVTIGCNETSMVLLLLVTGLAWLVALLFHRKSFLFCTVMLAVAGVCAAAVVLSPGNAVREAFMPPHKQLVPTLVNSWKQFKEFTEVWTSSFLLYAMTLAFLRPLQSLGVRIKRLHRVMRHPATQIFVVAYGLLGVYATIAPSWWSKGVGVIPRTLNITYFAFAFTWFIGVAFIAAYFAGKIRVRPEARRAWAIGTGIVLAYALLTHPWVKGGLDELTTTGPRFRSDLRSRYALITQARNAGQREVVVPALTACPPNVCVLDISSCRAGWPNTSYGEWFGMESVRLPGPPNACPNLPKKATEVVNPYSLHLFRPR